MNKKVSIIVPVYNASKYINKCVDSIINQTYKNIEIILINDGSTDDSLKIIKEYEKNNRNVKVYSHKNMGAGKTRNKGIRLSKGDYITFVDSDDFINNDYIEMLATNIENNDIIISGFNRYNNNYNLTFASIPTCNKIDLFKYLSTCSKLYKKEFLEKNNISFSKIVIGEDILYILNCYSKTNKVKIIKYAGYNVYENISSLTHLKKNETNLFDLVKEIDKTINLKKYGDLYLFFYLKTIIMNLLMQSKSINFKEYYKLYLNSFSWLEEVYKKNNKKLKKIWIKDEDMKINLCVNIFIILRKVHLIKPFLYILRKINVKL